MSNNKQNQPIRISVDQASEQYEAEDVTILDVVDPGSYKQTTDQIESAFRIDPREISDDYDQLPEDRTVLAYCT